MNVENEKCVIIVDENLPLGIVVDFSDLARGCKTYNEFIGKMANTSESRLNYIGIAVCGNKKQINKLTGSMPLLR